jgi:hypothetical protein
MGEIITIQFRRSRLRRRWLNDGSRLESPAVLLRGIAFPKRHAPKSKLEIRHLILVDPGN